ncbi:hypothetical protein FNZ18_19270 [Salmonella enterica subsp. salamae]|nr:hypothetical protein [Salmonella enterica subsp. salamae]
MKGVHPLIKIVRDKELPHPSQLDKFNPQSWIEFCERINVKDDVAITFFSGACWLNDHFNRIQKTRQQFSWAGDQPLDYRDLIRAHISATNYAFWAVVDEQEKKYETEPVLAIEQMLVAKSSMVGKNDPVNVNRVLMHRLDSLRGPLWELFKYKDNIQKLFPNDRDLQLAPIDFFYNEMRLSQFYHGLGEQWQLLLYGNVLFYAEKEKVNFIHRHSFHRMKTISEFRREQHQSSSWLEAQAILKKKSIIPLQKTYLHFKRGNFLGVTTWEKLTEKTRKIAQYQYIAPFGQLEEHLKPLLQYHAAPSIGHSVQVILDVWLHLTVLSAQISESLFFTDELQEWPQLLALAPEFDRNHLVNILSQCTFYTVSDINEALVLLIWRGKTPQEDLWAQPLVELDNNVIFPVSAFLTASISRNVDCWLTKIDPEGRYRGKMFERDMIRVLEECKKYNTVMSQHLHYTPAIKESFGGVTEEIDLTFSFGNILVVAELRSRKTPITPLDYENDLYDSNGLEHKTKQAVRKAAFIQGNIKEFCEKYYPDLISFTNIQVIPLVIINGQFHAGYCFNNVPVTDAALLLHFLKYSELRLNYDYEHNRHQYGISLWHSLDEAQKCFVDYINCPYLIQLYDSMLSETISASHNLGDDYGEIVSLSYEMPDGFWETVVEKAEKLFPCKVVKYF